MNNSTRKIAVIVTVLLLSVQIGFAQKADSATKQRTSPMYDLYMQRHKTFNTVGWALLVPGTVMFTIGMANSSHDNFFSDSFSRDATLITIGAGMALASIPCFILAKTSKEKALLQFKSAVVPGPGGNRYVAVNLAIHL